MSIPDVYLNFIETAVPDNNAHDKFISFIPRLLRDERTVRLIQRLEAKCQIERRYSVLTPSPQAGEMDQEGFYELGHFASTEMRMRKYEKEALPLALKALTPIFKKVEPRSITHLIVTSCTGFYAPGIDLEIQRHFKMRSDLERSIIGFMGCYAAFNALKAAFHIVRSQPEAKVLMVNLELCTLHLQEETEVEKVIGYLQFADGCAASVISAETQGLKLERFRAEVVSEASDLIQWHIGNQGFKMVLSTDVPKALSAALPGLLPKLLTGEERAEIRLWAIHPGGRSILDAVQSRLELTDEEIRPSREVLRNFGNMSSATVMFVLKSILDDQSEEGPGLAMAFGPGLTVESLRFHKPRNQELH